MQTSGTAAHLIRLSGDLIILAFLAQSKTPSHTDFLYKGKISLQKGNVCFQSLSWPVVSLKNQLKIILMLKRHMPG